MTNLVEITNPYTGEKYMVHPWVAEHGEWFAQDDKSFRAQFPGIDDAEKMIGVLLARKFKTEHASLSNSKWGDDPALQEQIVTRMLPVTENPQYVVQPQQPTPKPHSRLGKGA